MPESRLSDRVYDVLRANASDGKPPVDDDVDDATPVHHKKLARLVKHLFSTTSTHEEAANKLQGLIQTNGELYDDDK